MIELNLLPQEFRKKVRRRIELPQIPIIPLAAALMGVMVTLHLFLGGLILVYRNQLSLVNKTWQSLAPEKAELDSIKLAIKTTTKKNQAIERLIEKRLSWARLLNELSDSLTDNIWLTGLSCQARAVRASGKGKIRTLTLSGSASAKGKEATRDIARFIKALKANKNFFKNFEDIELISIKKGTPAAGQDLMDFILLCRFKKENG